MDGGERSVFATTSEDLGQLWASLDVFQAYDRATRRGSHVILADVDLDAAERVAAGILTSGEHASARHLDVASFAEFRDAVHGTLEELGRLDLIFNNAGIGASGGSSITR